MLWIVGNAFRDMREYLQTHGIAYGILTNQHFPAKKALDGVRTVSLDYSSAEKLRLSAELAQLDVTALLAAGYENYVLPAAILAETYHLPGLSLDAAQATTDKAVMRAKFQVFDPTISPDFAVVNGWQDIEQFLEHHSLPVMLKPTNLMKSLFVTKNDSLDELRQNYQATVQALQTKGSEIYTMEPPRIIIEECMTGSMHTVAGYADTNGQPHLIEQTVDCITGQDVGKKQNYIYSRQLPTALNATQSAAVLEVARKGVRALGLTSTMLHIEIMLTADGPKIIEIGARIGGYRTRMYAYGAGIDMNAIMLDVAAGKAPAITGTVNRPIAVIELFPDDEGNFTEIAGEVTLRELPSLRHFSIKAEPDETIGRSSHGYKAVAVVILGNDDTAQFEQDLEFVRTNVHVQTDS